MQHAGTASTAAGPSTPADEHPTQPGVPVSTVTAPATSPTVPPGPSYSANATATQTPTVKPVGDVTGLIEDAKSNAPVVGAKVQLSTGQSAVSGLDGTYRIPDDGRLASLPVGSDGVRRFTVTVEANGYGSSTLRNWMYSPGATYGAALTDQAVDRDLLCVPRALKSFHPECSRLPDGPTAALPAAAQGPNVANAVTSCSGYYSDVAPPSTIRILRTSDSTMVTRDCRTYVKEVLPNEWIPSWNESSLQAGAMAVRNFGWWWVNNGPNGYVNGQCYDVRDDTGSQVWLQNSSTSTTNAAVDAIWSASRATRNDGSGSKIFPTYYKAGNPNEVCGQWNGVAAPGNDMSQNGSQTCAVGGQKWPGIFRTYYFSPIPTVLDEDPAATEYNQPGDPSWHLNVYVTHTDGNVYEKFQSNSTWWSWQSIGAPSGGCTSSPGTASSGGNNLWLFCRSTSGAIWYRKWNGSSWSSWTQVSSTSMQSGPAASEFYYSGDGSWHINVEAVGWDGALWQNYYVVNTGTWSGWQSLGSPSGGCTGKPAADNGLSPRFFVICRAPNGETWYRQWTGASWSSWTSLGGYFSSTPGATDYYQPGDTWHFNVYVDALDGSIYEQYKSGGNPFSGWQYQGGVCQSGAGPSNYSSTDLEVFCRWNGSGDVWYERYNGSTWSGWNYNIGHP